jgi:glycosyltransferase involved in cell wall biosynthesis
MSKPLLSIICIFYNKEHNVTKCINSILNQPESQFCEIICVNDGSTDDTLKCLEKYPQVTIVNNDKNMGTCYTRYIGLKHAHGKYCWFIDGDDYVLENSLSIIFNEIRNVKADVYEFNIKTNGKGFSQPINDQLIKKNILSTYANKEIKNVLWNKIISRKVYKKIVKKYENIKHDNYSDVVYFLFMTFSYAKSVQQCSKTIYFYDDFVGMTALDDKIEKLKHYCNFEYTYQSLMRIFGDSQELFSFKNIVANQAILTYLTLTAKEQKQHYKELLKLIDKNDIEYLISQHKKRKQK